VKTISLKKVSALAVASLGFGLMSVVPAQAGAGTCTAWTQFPTSKVTALNLVGATANTNTTNSAVVVNMGATLANTTTTANDEATCAAVKFIGYLSSYPAGAFAAVTTGAAGTPLAFTGANATDTTSPALTVRQTTSGTGITGAEKPATAAAGIGAFTFTPTKVGTYVLSVFNDTGSGATFGTLTNAPEAIEFIQSISIVVTAESTYSNTLSTAFITPGLGGTGADFATTPAIATADVAVNANATMAAAARASITVKLFDSSNTAMVAGKVASITAEVSGPGGVKVSADNTPTAPTCSTTATAPDGRSVTFTSEDEINHVYVCADGTPGVSTIKVYVTDLLGVKTLLSTKTVTFFGAVTKIVATGVLTNAAAGGAALGVATAARTAGVTPSVIVKATDAAGNPVSGLNASITLKSSNTVVMTEAITCGEDIKATANVASSGGSGFYNCQTTSSSGAKSGDKATLTFRVVDPAGDGTTYLTSDVAFTIGGSATTGTETIAFDKTSYAPGEAMVITRTAKDSSGNPVADGTASPNFSFSKGTVGTPAAGTYVAGASKSATSSATSTIFAPVTPGSFIVTATAANGATITATATVTDANAALVTQIDALNAKIVALNALIAKIMKKLGVK
jgi:hypothetical protein